MLRGNVYYNPCKVARDSVDGLRVVPIQMESCYFCVMALKVIKDEVVGIGLCVL